MTMSNGDRRTTIDQAMPLFVYGTLLEPGCRQRILGHPVPTRPARLDGFRASRGRHFYLVPTPDAWIDGLILLDLDAADFAALDRYEEVPQLYTRETVEVIAPNDERLRCWIYMPTRELTRF